MSSGQSLGDSDITATPGRCDSFVSGTWDSSTSSIKSGSLTGGIKSTSNVGSFLPLLSVLASVPVSKNGTGYGSIQPAIRPLLEPSPDSIRPRPGYHLEWHPIHLSPSYRGG